MPRLLLLLLAVISGSAFAQAPTPDRYLYHDLPSQLGIPTASFTLLGDVLGDRQGAVRAHAWTLWSGLTAPSTSIVDGQRLPIFQTWYSIDEVYNPRGRDGVSGRTLRHPVKRPTQAAVAANAHGSASAGLMSFVKLNRASADFIWDKGYYLTPVLRGLNTRFSENGTATVERSIEPFPSSAVGLKLVFWLVKAASSPQSDNGLTALPIWNPGYPPPANGVPPMHTTWKEAVAIDPSGRHKTGTVAMVNVNGTRDKPNLVPARVVPLEHFYSHRLGSAADVADAVAFSKMMSSAAGEQERLVTNAGQTPEIGDHLVLLAMHVTTKEIDDWTFQTFWWMPDANAAPFGHDRPSSIKAPFDNYQMCTAYSTVSPRTSERTLPVCFNPYLETDLGPTRPYTMDGRTWPAAPMAGTRSNCQNCHRRAAYPAFDPKAPAAADFGHVANDGYRSPGDAYFDKLLKTDFMWSIALKNISP